MAERDRPIGGPLAPGELPGVVIVSPASFASVIVPGALPVRIEVSRTSGLLESVGLTVIRFAGQVPVVDTTLTFDPTVGDTALAVTLQLESFPSSTQLNLQAEARVSGRSLTSDEVPVTAVNCDDLPPEFCS